MNLTDIEKAVVELSFRHPGLTKEFLRTLLEASGWEEKHIKEAQIICAAHFRVSSHVIEKEQGILEEIPLIIPQTLPVPHQNTSNLSKKEDDMTFLRSDGTEEGSLHLEELKDEPPKDPQEEKSIIETTETIETVKNVAWVDTAQVSAIAEHIEDEKKLMVQKEDALVFESSVNHNEEKSLIKDERFVLSGNNHAWQELPENLPLIPFESAPHVWSFGRYKDTFYREPEVKEEKIDTAATVSYIEKEEKDNLPIVQEIPPQEPVLSQTLPEIKAEVAHIDFEKTPIGKGEESLVVLAGVMLLAIMLILGYMYGNGRL